MNESSNIGWKDVRILAVRCSLESRYINVWDQR